MRIIKEAIFLYYYDEEFSSKVYNQYILSAYPMGTHKSIHALYYEDLDCD
jgi:hypothetical protein